MIYKYKILSIRNINLDKNRKLKYNNDHSLKNNKNFL